MRMPRLGWEDCLGSPGDREWENSKTATLIVSWPQEISSIYLNLVTSCDFATKLNHVMSVTEGLKRENLMFRKNSRISVIGRTRSSRLGESSAHGHTSSLLRLHPYLYRFCLKVTHLEVTWAVARWWNLFMYSVSCLIKCAQYWPEFVIFGLKLNPSICKADPHNLDCSISHYDIGSVTGRGGDDWLQEQWRRKNSEASINSPGTIWRTRQTTETFPKWDL